MQLCSYIIVRILLLSFPPPWITDDNSNQWLLDACQVDFSHWLPVVHLVQ